MTTEEMFTKLKEEQNKTKHAHHVTTNNILTASKVIVCICLCVAAITSYTAYDIYLQKNQAQLRRSIDKALFVAERLDEARDPRGKPLTDEHLLWRVSNIVQDPNFDWDMRFKIPGIACTTVNQLADSDTNRFTELLKERRDGPIALTLNK